MQLFGILPGKNTQNSHLHIPYKNAGLLAQW